MSGNVMGAAGWALAAYFMGGLSIMMAIAPDEQSNTRTTTYTVAAGVLCAVPVALYVVLRYGLPHVWRTLDGSQP